MDRAETGLIIPKNLSDQIYEILIQKIISGEYKTGSRIDTNQLASQFKISRSPVKDALNKLAGAEILEISPRKGHFIRRISEKEVESIFEFRLMLEVSAAKIASRFLTAEVYRSLSETIEQDKETADYGPPEGTVRGFQLDRKFHETIVDLARNDLLSKAHSHVHLLSHAARTQFLIETCEWRLIVQEQHKSILEAVLRKDFAEIERCMSEHLMNAKDLLLQFMRERANSLTSQANLR